MPEPTPLDDFLFDLNGYLVLKHAVEPELLDALNLEFDAFPRDLPLGHWYRGAQRRDYNSHTGLELHNCLNMGGPFAQLIDHPGYINHVRRYAGEERSYLEGVFIDESLASIRTSGGHHPVHSGGYLGALRGRYLYQDGRFRCGQVNVILALSDIGPGDGPTMIIPGSHKSHFPHPEAAEYAKGNVMDTITGAIPVHLNKGDVVLFVDGIMHGGAGRTNPGERRVTIFRYGPIWGASRFGYTYSRELLDSLTPERRQILEPKKPILEGETWIPNER